MNRGRGRPPAADPRTARVVVRVTPAEAEAIHARAEGEGVSTSELLRGLWAVEPRPALAGDVTGAPRADLVTIDPGVRYVATAWWSAGRLVALARLTTPSGVEPVAGLPPLWTALLALHDPSGEAQVVSEDPQDYEGKGAKHHTLKRIRATVEALEVVTAGHPWARARPGVWKGSVPKDIHHRRIAEAMGLDELEVASGARGIPRWNGTEYDRDLADAIGIGLWWLGRLGRGGVRP